MVRYFHIKKVRELEGLSHSLVDEPVAPTTAIVITNPATNIKETEATLSATLVSLGGAKTVLTNFVYEGNATPVTTMTETGKYTLRVTHLLCNTTYSFNATALNSFGPSDGPTRVFTTKACGGDAAGKVTTPTAKKK